MLQLQCIFRIGKPRRGDLHCSVHPLLDEGLCCSLGDTHKPVDFQMAAVIGLQGMLEKAAPESGIGRAQENALANPSGAVFER